MENLDNPNQNMDQLRKPYKVKLSSRTWSDVSKEVIVPIGPIFSKVDVGAIILKVKNETEISTYSAVMDSMRPLTLETKV